MISYTPKYYGDPIVLLLFFTCLCCFFNLRLMFDPYAKVVYDYLGGIEDIKKAKV